MGYKMLGISDETTCECCGKENLKRTVIVGRTDRDGSVIETLKFGRDCAARVTLIRRSGAAIERLAEDAQRRADETAIRTPVRLGDGEKIWVVESIGSNGGKVDFLRYTIGGGYHATVAWAEKQYPAKEVHVRPAR